MKTKDILTYKRAIPMDKPSEGRLTEMLMVIIGLLAGRVEIWGMVMPTGVSWALANFKSGKNKNLLIALCCSAIGMILSGIDIYKLRGIITLVVIYAVSSYRLSLWEDSILPTAIFGAVINFLCGAIIFGVMNVPGFDYIMLGIEAVIVVSTTLCLKNLSEIVKRGGSILGDDEAISLCMAVGMAGAGLKGINIAGIELSVILSLYIIAFTAKKAGVGISVTIATVMGLVTGGDLVIEGLALYVFAAVCCSLLASMGNWGVVAGMGAADAIYVFCSLGLGKPYVGEVICAAALFYFTPVRVMDKMVKYTSFPGKEFYGYSRLAHQKSETDTAISQIEDAAWSVAEVIKQMNREENFETESREIINKVQNGVCSKCSLKSSCGGKNKSRSEKLIQSVIECVYAGENPVKKSGEEISGWKCIHPGDIVTRVCDVMEFYRKNNLLHSRQIKNTQYAVSTVEGISRIISRRRQLLAAGYLCYETYSEEIMENLIRNGISCFGVSVMKNAAGLFEVIAEVEAPSLKNAEDIIKEIMKIKMKTASEEKTSKGILLHLKEKEHYSCEVAVMSLENPGKTSGDSTIWFEDGRGQLYSLLADGMGSGSIAAKESGWTCKLFEKLIKAGGEVKETFKIINNVLIASNKNEACLSADAVKVNLNTGVAEFTKAGGASAYIKTKNGAEKIGWASLPLGILDICELESRCYDMSEGGFIVLMSDGVPDTSGDRMEGEHILRRSLEFCDETEPREVAEQMLFAAMSMGAPKDDMTVTAIKVIKK